MDLARRITDGIFTAILVYLVFSLHTGFADVITTGGSAVSKLAYTLQGRSDVFGKPA